MILIFHFVAFYFLIHESSGQSEDVVAAGTLGNIRGMFLETVLTKRPYLQFIGIPYADSPGGANRFIPVDLKTTLDRENEDDVFNATSFMPPCAQSNTTSLPNGSLSEDCLGINIWTPNIRGKLPVITFIHGGSFMDGNANAYSGGRLLERDVVVVSFNYRLGILGFYCLDHERAPGNAAMYDLITALKWVKTYIGYFGGDADLVTVAGQSAGSAAAVQLLLSPLAKGQNLFHRVIAVSGSALNEWGTSKDPVHHSVKVSRFANCYNGSDEDALRHIEEIITCMKDQEPVILTRALQRYQDEERKEARIGFGPVSPSVQRSSFSPIFLQKAPLDILAAKEQSNVPLMIGTTRHDGSFVLTVLYYQYLRVNGLISNSLFLRTQLVPNLLRALGVQDDTMAIYESLSSFYLGDARKSGNFTEMIPGLIDIHSVFFFKAGAYQTAVLHSTLQPNTFWYSFDFYGRNSIPDSNAVIPAGIGHAHDMVYLFPLSELDNDEQVISKMLVDYWANFALTGDPNVNSSSGNKVLPMWPKFSQENPLYIQIGNGQFMNMSVKVGDNYPEEWKDASLELITDPGISTSTTESSSTYDTTTHEETPENENGYDHYKYNNLKKEKDVYLALFVVFCVLTIISGILVGFLYRKVRNNAMSQS